MTRPGARESALAEMLELTSRDGDDDFLKLTAPSDLNPCPVCGSPPELWQRKHEDQFHKVVACPNIDRKETVGYECPLYFPPECYYKATRREAVAYWQKYSKGEVSG